MKKIVDSGGVRKWISIFRSNARAYNLHGKSNLIWPVVVLLRNSQYKNTAISVCQNLARGRILDIGCGSGSALLNIASKSPKVDCVGIDIELDLLNEGRRKADKLKYYDRISFIQADVKSIPFADNSFDMVMSMFSFHQWHDHNLA